jgi:hypothetical protein
LSTQQLSLQLATSGQNGALSSTDWTTFNSKENAITAGTTAQYFRGDKTFQTLNTSVVPEGTNLYYTEARVNANANVAANTAARHNAVTLGTANGLSLNTQQLSLGLASAGVTGALSGTDWSTFNSKQNALTNPVTGTGTINYLPKFTGTSAIGNSAIYDNAGNIGIGTLIPRALLEVDGQSYLKEIWNQNGIYFGSFDTGAANTFIYGEGANTGPQYLDFAVNFVTRLKIADGGNVLIGTITNSGFKLDVNGTGRFIGNLTAASFIRSGGTSSQYLMADGSVSTLTNPVTGTGTAGQVAYWSSGSAITGESNLFWDATNDRLGIGTATPSTLLQVFTNTSNAGRIRVTSTTSTAGNYRGYEFGNSSGFRGGIVQDESTEEISIFTPIGGNSVRISSNGNLGLGVTPSAWGLRGFDISNGSLFGDTNNVGLTQNAYYGSSWVYKNNGTAANYIVVGNEHRWNIAPSGTAGNAISFTQAMTLGTNSGLSIGTPSAAPSQGLLVQGVGTFNTNLNIGSIDTTVTIGGVTNANTEGKIVLRTGSTKTGWSLAA